MARMQRREAAAGGMVHADWAAWGVVPGAGARRLSTASQAHLAFAVVARCSPLTLRLPASEAQRASTGMRGSHDQRDSDSDA
eukprot:379089-Rhodomonas_salina.4